MSRFRADADELARRKQIAGRVESGLTPNEQETGISFFGDADRAEITTYSPTIARSLLQHAYAEIEWVYSRDPEGQNYRVHDLSEFDDSEARLEIGGVRATIPLGALSIKGAPRTKDYHSGIVTTPEEIEGLSEVFEDE